MTIRWLGHACFLITSKAGVRVLIDPFDASVGYKVPAVEADVVLSTHDHSDHNAINVVKGQPQIIKGSGRHQAKGIDFTGVSSFHDTAVGSLRGRNTIFAFELDGVRLCHLGDLGHVLDTKQLEKLEGTDILLIPVGGKYTINAAKAVEVISQIEPRIIIPMHYKIPGLKADIDGVEKFIKELGIKQRQEEKLKIFKKDLPQEDMELVILSM